MNCIKSSNDLYEILHIEPVRAVSFKVCFQYAVSQAKISARLNEIAVSQGGEKYPCQKYSASL